MKSKHHGPSFGPPCLVIIFIGLPIMSVLRHQISSWMKAYFLLWAHSQPTAKPGFPEMSSHVPSLSSLLWVPMSDHEPSGLDRTGSLLWQLGRSTMQPRPLRSDMAPASVHPMSSRAAVCRYLVGVCSTHTSFPGPLVVLVFTMPFQKTQCSPESNSYGSKSEPAPSPSSLQTEGCVIKSGRHSPRTGPWGVQRSPQQ